MINWHDASKELPKYNGAFLVAVNTHGTKEYKVAYYGHAHKPAYDGYTSVPEKVWYRHDEYDPWGFDSEVDGVQYWMEIIPPEVRE